MCSVVYVLDLEEIERRVTAERLGCLMLRSAGAEVEVPTVEATRAEYEQWLRAEPATTVKTDDEMTVRRALGLDP